MGFACSNAVNMASRMESVGMPRRIQVFQHKADAVMLQGKQNWLVPRKKKVVAKGRGEMQRYLLEWNPDNY